MSATAITRVPSTVVTAPGGTPLWSSAGGTAGKREPGARPAHHGGSWRRLRRSCTRPGPNRP
jgi:hypothetical protein